MCRWVDNLLDTIMPPAAVVAGTLKITMAVSGKMSQFCDVGSRADRGRWNSRCGANSTVAATKVFQQQPLVDWGNFVVATGELIGSIVLSILAFVMPVVITVFVIILVIVVARWIQKKDK